MDGSDMFVMHRGRAVRRFLVKAKAMTKETQALWSAKQACMRERATTKINGLSLSGKLAGSWWKNVPMQI